MGDLEQALQEVNDLDIQVNHLEMPTANITAH